MQMMLASRVCFAVSLFLWAVAAVAGPAGAGFGALGAMIVLLPYLAWTRFAGLKEVFRDPYLWGTALIFTVVNIASAIALALLPLPAFAAINQCSPLIGLAIAPLWGERPLSRDWLLVFMGVAGALLVVEANISGTNLLGFLAALATISFVSVSVHRWGYIARNKNYQVVPATFVLMLPAIPLMLFSGAEMNGKAALLYAVGGALLAVGNALSYKCYAKDWSVTHSLLLKPLGVVFLAGAGVLFLGDPLAWQTVVGAILILIASTVVGLEHGKNEVTTSA